MWMLCGLGNPGRKYERTRHNVGFFVVDELVRRHHLGGFRERMGAHTADGLIGPNHVGDKVLLVKPMEYMNHSGFAVQRLASYHSIEPERIVVIHDDLDLDVGRVKLKSGGGHGGHNGLRSIVQQLGSRGFLRVRIGIGKPARADAPDGPRVSGSSYVLSDIPTAERDAIDQAVSTAADACESIVARGIKLSMNEFNAREVSGEADQPS